MTTELHAALAVRGRTWGDQNAEQLRTMREEARKGEGARKDAYDTLQVLFVPSDGERTGVCSWAYRRVVRGAP